MVTVNLLKADGFFRFMVRFKTCFQRFISLVIKQTVGIVAMRGVEKKKKRLVHGTICCLFIQFYLISFLANYNNLNWNYSIYFA